MNSGTRIGKRPKLRLNPRFAIAGIITLLATFTGGCQAMQGYLKDAQKPSARVVGTHLADLKPDAADLVFDVEVTNPYSAALPLTNLDYALASGGKPFLTGKAPVQGNVPANGTKTVSLPARMNFAQVLQALEGVRPGAVVPYDADLRLSADAPVVGTVTLPLKKSGQVPIPAVPTVELSSVEWKGLDLNKAAAVLHLNVGNPNQFALGLSKLGLGLSLAGHSVASTSVDQATSIAAGGNGTLDVPITFSPRDMGLSAFQVLQGKGSDYKVSGLLSAKTPFGPMELPYERTGTTNFLSK